MKRLFICLLLLPFAIGACRLNTIDIQVNFDRLSGLSKGDRVLFQSNPAGEVSSVTYKSDDRYVVELAMDKGFAHALTEYSQFHLVDDQGRAGHKAIEIRLTRKDGKKLADGAVVTGVPEPESILSQFRKEIEKGLKTIEKQIEQYGRDIEAIPESKEYQQLKKSLNEWAKEMERAGNHARKKMEEQWLPRIEKELDALRRWLKEQGREEEIESLEKEVDRIRKI